MKEYDVKITETLEKTVTVQAESHDAAEEQVRAAYYNSEYILDSENFTGVAFGTTEEREVQKEQADTMNVLLVKPFMYPQAVQIGCELEDLQKAVGGDIEATYPFNEPVALVMHDEGKLVGKELNRALRDDDGDIYDISNALQIPLTASKNAPNTKPIQLKRIVRQSSAKPTVKTAIPEPCISDSDYENINNIILMCGTTMEKTARTYFANTEEELRDHLLATLNTHYESATGETFRKIGKTDIHIEFENKAAFIGECKIWHGERLFQGAIQQVINYSTWRDMKVSVIIFNKENQSFPAIISKIKSWADSNTVSYTQPQANIWKCKYHRQDMNVDIQLMILAFDLYVDKSQFKDSRYEN